MSSVGMSARISRDNRLDPRSVFVPRMACGQPPNAGAPEVYNRACPLADFSDPNPMSRIRDAPPSGPYAAGPSSTSIRSAPLVITGRS